MGSPRREGGEPRSLDEWDSWIDRAITDAQRRGDFDDLPGAGKPLDISSNPLAPEWDAASGILKSAGVVPLWIELDKEIRAETAALAELRDQTAQRLGEQLADLRAAEAARERLIPPTADTPPPPDRPRWWRFRRRRARQRPPDPGRPRLGIADLEASRQRARRDYLDRAAELNAKIAEYQAALPKDLWRLERTRLPPDKAARDFDATCPPITDDARRAPQALDVGTGPG
jgi:hypothetical protein